MASRQNVIIHPDAQIGENVRIDPFVTIAGDVRIGDGTWIGSHVIIDDGVRLGTNCQIFPGAILGMIPQDLKYAGEKTFLEIGDNVKIREYCTINKGTKAAGTTFIGNDCLLMAYVHVAHDCHIADHAILANCVNMAGHVEVGSYAIVSAMSAIHQFVKLGCHSMVSGGSLVRKDVPPYVKAAREPLSYVGVNTIGLERRGFSEESIRRIQDIYRILYVKGWNIGKAIDHISSALPDSPEKTEILAFIDHSERGLMKGFQHA